MRGHRVTRVLPRKYFHFAVMDMGGWSGFFDFLRYEQATVVDFRAMRALVQACNDRDSRFFKDYSVEVRKYSKVKKPDWTLERLSTTQKLTPLEYGDYRVRLLGKDRSEIEFSKWELPSPVKPLVYQNDLFLEDIPVIRVIEIMYFNGAFPAREIDANSLETGILEHGGKVTVLLRLFTHEENDIWQTGGPGFCGTSSHGV